MNTKGPFPKKELLEAIFSLPQNKIMNIDKTDFFGAKNGWDFTVLTQDGYNPPPDSVPWTTYNDSDKPLSQKDTNEVNLQKAN